MTTGRAETSDGLPRLPAPGWYDDPSGQHAIRWWDGGRWTDFTADRRGWWQAPDGNWYPPPPRPPPPPPRPPAPPLVRTSKRVRWGMTALTLTGGAVLVWGAIAVGSTSTVSASNPGSGCADYPGIDIGPLWVPWLVLVVLAVAGGAIWLSVLSQARHEGVKMDPVIALAALLGITAVVVLFPAWMTLGTGLNCSL